MKGFPDLPPIWWAASMGVIYIAKWALPQLHFDVGAFASVASAIFWVALGLIAWSGIWFWRKKTPIEPHHTPKTLIKEGPFRISRNPIYLGLVMLTVASALSNGSIIGVVAAIGLWVILDRRFAAKEEALLLRTFGDEARDYLADTRRWL